MQTQMQQNPSKMGHLPGERSGDTMCRTSDCSFDCRSGDCEELLRAGDLWFGLGERGTECGIDGEPGASGLGAGWTWAREKGAN